MSGTTHYWKSILIYAVVGTGLYLANIGWLACFFVAAMLMRMLEAAIFSAIIEARYYKPKADTWIP